jgi:uncharacterized protein
MTEQFTPTSDQVQSEMEKQPTPAVAPVTAQERLFSIDALRGLAVLGILVMNIPFFAAPDVAMNNPTLMGEAKTLNTISWFVSSVIFEGKMRALFSMLFGAGVVILTSRAEQRSGEGKIADIYYRRTLWLLFFGLLHAYLLWDGDILFWYGLFGLLLYPFRKLSGATLIIVGVLLLGIMVLKGVYSHHERETMQADAQAAEEALDSGQLPTDEENTALKTQNALKNRDKRIKERIAKRIKQHQSDYWTIFKARAMENFRFIPMVIYQGGVDDVLSMMLIGMGLVKLGIITAQRSNRFYVLMALIGYGIGLSLNSYLAYLSMTNDYDVSNMFLLYFSAYNFDRLMVALGHAAVVMLICKSSRAWLLTPLAAVGQMALTNYLSQSAICTTLFYGYGFGWYGKLERYELWYVVLAIWVFQLTISPIWLRIFRFGPMEWLWRSLTYWKCQPFLNR